ncbi:hypothetical protein [Tropicibacter oceani]|uniref:Uncharacterized protein n=1 Tax=Tropicibacter oceani TaxID=3058420 RepID=A0ABY8QGD5_9RHOB|nr:hypothetical protein [Tropicibacter oceani]WGW03579.1 hypothetical protein QF118_16890 [Tropicibacter oceani]
MREILCFDVKVLVPRGGEMRGWIIEPANRGNSEIDRLFAPPGFSTGGCDFLIDRGFAIITFGWQPDLCNCGNKDLLSLRSRIVKRIEPRSVHLSIRLTKAGNSVALGAEYGHPLAPSYDKATVTDELSLACIEARIRKDDNNHLSFDAGQTLRPGRRYRLDYLTNQERDSVFLHVLDMTRELIVEQRLAKWLEMRPPDVITWIGISQSARFLREALKPGTSQMGAGEQCLLFGSGGAGLATSEVASLNEAEAVPLRPLAERAAMTALSLDFSTEKWCTPSDEHGPFLCSTAHGDSLALRLPRQYNGDWFRPSALPPVDFSPSVRAIFQHIRVDGIADWQASAPLVPQSQSLKSLFPWANGELGFGGLGSPFVPPLDACCNESGSVLPLELRVPLGTYTGWGCFPDRECLALLPGVSYAEPLLSRAQGSDPWRRPMLEDLYPTDGKFIDLVDQHCEKLLGSGELLAEDLGYVRSKHIRRFRELCR